MFWEKRINFGIYSEDESDLAKKVCSSIKGNRSAEEIKYNYYLYQSHIRNLKTLHSPYDSILDEQVTKEFENWKENHNKKIL